MGSKETGAGTGPEPRWKGVEWRSVPWCDPECTLRKEAVLDYECSLCQRRACTWNLCLPAVRMMGERVKELESVVDRTCSALQQHPLGMSRTGEKTVVEVAKLFVKALREKEIT